MQQEVDENLGRFNLEVLYQPRRRHPLPVAFFALLIGFIGDDST